MRSARVLRSCLVAVACGTAALGMATTAVAEEPAEIAAIRAAIGAYLEAWNRGDVRALASFYDEDYDWMNPLGVHLQGRDAVVAFEAGAFERPLPPGVKHTLQYEVNSIRLITDDVAVVDMTYSGTGMGPHPETPVHGMIISVYVQKNGRWLRASQRNFTLMSPGA